MMEDTTKTIRLSTGERVTFRISGGQISVVPQAEKKTTRSKVKPKKKTTKKKTTRSSSNRSSSGTNTDESFRFFTLFVFFGLVYWYFIR